MFWKWIDHTHPECQKAQTEHTQKTRRFCSAKKSYVKKCLQKVNSTEKVNSSCNVVPLDWRADLRAGRWSLILTVSSQTCSLGPLAQVQKVTCAYHEWHATLVLKEASNVLRTALISKTMRTDGFFEQDRIELACYTVVYQAHLLQEEICSFAQNGSVRRTKIKSTGSSTTETDKNTSKCFWLHREPAGIVETWIMSLLNTPMKLQFTLTMHRCEKQ
jgi:hypothetical protein